MRSKEVESKWVMNKRRWQLCEGKGGEALKVAAHGVLESCTAFEVAVEGV